MICCIFVSPFLPEGIHQFSWHVSDRLVAEWILPMQDREAAPEGKRLQHQLIIRVTLMIRGNDDQSIPPGSIVCHLVFRQLRQDDFSTYWHFNGRAADSVDVLGMSEVIWLESFSSICLCKSFFFLFLFLSGLIDNRGCEACPTRPSPAALFSYGPVAQQQNCALFQPSRC